MTWQGCLGDEQRTQIWHSGLPVSSLFFSSSVECFRRKGGRGEVEGAQLGTMFL